MSRYISVSIFIQNLGRCLVFLDTEVHVFKSSPLEINKSAEQNNTHIARLRGRAKKSLLCVVSLVMYLFVFVCFSFFSMCLSEPFMRNGRPPTSHSMHSFLHQYTGSFKKPPLRRPHSVIGGTLGSFMAMPRNGSRLGERRSRRSSKVRQVRAWKGRERRRRRQSRWHLGTNRKRVTALIFPSFLP